jgi:hypothetical protein
VAHDERAPKIETSPPLEALVVERVQEMLGQAHGQESSDTRLLFQRLSVEAVPVCEVIYSYRGGEPRSLWVYGEERRVHAPGAPRPWLKLTLLLGGLAAVILAGLGLAVWAALGGLHPALP